MTSHDLAGLFYITAGDQCDQLIMFFQKLWITFLLLQVFYAEPVHLFPQVVQQRDQSLVIGCSKDNIMEFYICFSDLRHITTL